MATAKRVKTAAAEVAEEIREATDDRADYVTVNPVTNEKTITKTGKIALGILVAIAVVVLLVVLL